MGVLLAGTIGTTYNSEYTRKLNELDVNSDIGDELINRFREAVLCCE